MSLSLSISDFRKILNSVKSNDEQEIVRLIEKRPEVIRLNACEMLRTAVEHNYPNLVRLLVPHSVLRVVDTQALNDAVRHNSKEIIALLQPISHPFHYSIALQQALNLKGFASKEMVELLLQKADLKCSSIGLAIEVCLKNKDDKETKNDILNVIAQEVENKNCVDRMLKEYAYNMLEIGEENIVTEFFNRRQAYQQRDRIIDELAQEKVGFGLTVKRKI